MHEKNTEIKQQLNILIEHQNAIKVTTGKIEALTRATEEHEQKLSKIRNELPDIQAMELQRENLLADVAIGTADISAVDPLDDAIDAAKQTAADIGASFNTVEKTFNGLTRKLQEQREILNQLQADEPGHIRRFLLTYAEQIGAEYAKYAELLNEHYTRLCGLAQLLRYKYDYNYLVVPGGGGFNIPRFNLNALANKHVMHKPGVLFCNPDTAASVSQWASRETDLIRAMGIEIE